MDLTSLMGLCAAFCTTAAFLPQAAKVIRTRRTQDISLIMYCVFVSGVLLWLIYGVLISDLPLILANFVTLVLAGTILIMKIKLG